MGGDLSRWTELVRDVLDGPDGLKALMALFRYILRVNPAARPEVLRGLLPGDQAPEVEEAVMSWYDEGVDRGRAEGRRAVLLKQLRVRFGELPADVVARIEEAGSAELDLWAERVITAPSLDGVLSAA